MQQEGKRIWGISALSNAEKIMVQFAVAVWTWELHPFPIVKNEEVQMCRNKHMKPSVKNHLVFQ